MKKLLFSLLFLAFATASMAQANFPTSFPTNPPIQPLTWNTRVWGNQGGANISLPIGTLGNWLSTTHRSVAYYPAINLATIPVAINTYNIIASSGTIDSLTIILPSSPINGSYIILKFVKQATALFFTNGTLGIVLSEGAANTQYQLVYDLAENKWY